ncbi:MAG: hypothetical protein N3B16_09325 [Candidatus Aminicenantes bacterium]|nr:hypothetical protein [Candidatus Aminicenantes bacterium]
MRSNKIWLFFFLRLVLSYFLCFSSDLQADQKEIISLIREIHSEIKPAALVTADGLRLWQSFLGQDDDDTYKDDHLVILVQEKDESVTLWIQVTKFKSESAQLTAKRAISSRMIKAVIQGQNWFIEKSDYNLSETEKILREILVSIQKKKKLLGVK